MILARHTCFCGALRSATTASSRRRSSERDLDDNPCSHPESLNRFGRFGNRPNESDHAGEEHLAGILAIYNHAVAHTTAIWNDVLVDLENRRTWWRGRTDAGFPILVAVEGDAVLGYASYGPFRAFDGYRQTVEHSVYVADGARRRGVASGFEALEAARARAGHARAARRHRGG